METPGAPVGFVLLSDGGLTDEQQKLLPPDTDYRRIGSRSTNRGLTRLTVEPRGSGLHARVSLRNTGGPAATQTLRLDVDGRTAHTEQVALDSGAAVEREIDLPGGDRVEAFLEGEDLLAADNHAFATARRRRPLKVLLAGPENVFLDRLFASLPAVTVERSDDARPAPGFDLVVYDGVAVPADPGAPFLAIAPPGGATTAGIAVTGEVENPAVTLVRSDDALLAGLDLSEVGIAKAQKLTAPAADVLVGAEGAPLLLRGAHGGRPFAYLAFALNQSNLPLQVAFPLLGDRLLTELAGAALPPADLRVGQPLPVSLAGPATVDAPAGVELQLAAGGAAPITDAIGYWTVHQEGRADVTFAVNADPGESAIAPAASLPVPERALAPGERRAAGERPWLKWFVIALLAVLAVEFLLSRRRKGVSRNQWRAAVALRGAIALLLVGALAGLAIPRTSKRVAVMFLVDGSDSLGAGGQAAAVDWVRDALRHQPDGALAGVAFFGGDARLELTVQADATLVQPATKVDASRTNLAGALRLAGAVLPSDARRRIVVVSDGRATEGDAATEAKRLREQGIRVDVHPVDALGGADMAVSRVDAPSHVKQGEAFTVRATITSSTAQTIALRWTRDGETVEERVVDVAAGQTIVELPQTAGGADAGATPLASYRLQVSGPADARLENNVGFAAVQVEGPARILLVEGMTGVGTTLADALRAGGLPVDVVGAAELPPIDRLATYSSTVLVDVDAHSLSNDQVASLTVATRDLGRGLVAVGGDRSFALGGYLDSELEKLLPGHQRHQGPAPPAVGGRGAGHRQQRVDGRLPLRRGGRGQRAHGRQHVRRRREQDRHLPGRGRPHHLRPRRRRPRGRPRLQYRAGVDRAPAAAPGGGGRHQGPAPAVARGRHRPVQAPAGRGRGPAQRQGQAQAHHPVHRRLHQRGRPRRARRPGRGAWPPRASPSRCWPPAKPGPRPTWPRSPRPGGAASTTRPTSARCPRS